MKSYLAYRYLVSAAVCALSLPCLEQSSRAQNLPHLDQVIWLDQAASTKLSADFSNFVGGGRDLSGDTESLLASLLPDSMKGACRNMVELRGPGRDQAKWSVRLLHAVERNGWRWAVIAYRCGFAANPNFSPFFDERPALLFPSGSLTFFPLDKAGEHSSDFYSVEYVRTLPIPGRGVMELEVTNIPQGDGPDSFSRTQTLLVDQSQGRIVLKVDSRTEIDTYDDETEQSCERVCETKLEDKRNSTDQVTGLVTVTTCTEDKVVKPSERLRYFWDPELGMFHNGDSAETRSPKRLQR